MRPDRLRRALLALLPALSALACQAAGPLPPAEPDPVVLFDHHVHLLGPRLVREWKSIGVPFSRPDAFYHSIDGWFDGSGNSPDGSALAGAVLVPMAHFYGNAEFRAALGLSLDEEQSAVREENEHVAREAARRPERTIALASADLLRPYALAELAHMRRAFGVPGVKLHLGSAGFDFRDEAHLAALETAVTWVVSEDLWLLLHLDPQRRGTEASDVRRLLERVLGPHPDLRVVIAHLGGSGGFGPWTQAVLATSTEWLADEARAGRPRPGVRFDLSAVPMLRESEGVPPSTPEELAALAPALRRLGLERLLFGSDFPVFDPREHARFLAERTDLAPAELARILAQRYPE
ncbi:MAG TPA: amidohydrolase family protein [Planctomycetota bacterium]